MKKVTGLSLLLCIGGVRSADKYYGNCGKGKVVFLEYPTSGLSAAKKTYMAGLDLTGCVSLASPDSVSCPDLNYKVPFSSAGRSSVVFTHAHVRCTGEGGQ